MHWSRDFPAWVDPDFRIRTHLAERTHILQILCRDDGHLQFPLLCHSQQLLPNNLLLPFFPDIRSTSYEEWIQKLTSKWEKKNKKENERP
jgi:hypothetical protein